MSAMTTAVRWSKKQADEYAGAGPERPLGAFGLLMGAYAGFVACGAALTARSKRSSAPPGPLDLVLMAVATAKLSRLMARDRVTSPLRAPFTSFEDFASADEVEEAPRGSGLQLALGELVTCPWCLAQWVGTGVLFGSLLAPRTTRLACAGLTAVALSDAVQHGMERQADVARS